VAGKQFGRGFPFQPQVTSAARYTHPPYAPITLVQSVAGTNTAGTSSVTATLLDAATAGNLIWAAFAGDKSSGTITPPAGSWTVAYTLDSTSVTIWVAWLVAAGGETAFTLSHATASAAGDTLWIGEYSDSSAGVWTILAAGNHGTDETTQTSWSSGTTAASTGDGYGIAFFAIDSGQSATAPPTYSNNFGLQRQWAASGRGDMAVAVLPHIPAGSVVETTSTHTPTADQISAAVAVFARVLTASVAAAGPVIVAGQFTPAASTAPVILTPSYLPAQAQPAPLITVALPARAPQPSTVVVSAAQIPVVAAAVLPAAAVVVAQQYRPPVPTAVTALTPASLPQPAAPITVVEQSPQPWPAAVAISSAQFPAVVVTVLPAATVVVGQTLPPARPAPIAVAPPLLPPPAQPAAVLLTAQQFIPATTDPIIITPALLPSGAPALPPVPVWINPSQTQPLLYTVTALTPPPLPTPPAPITIGIARCQPPLTTTISLVPANLPQAAAPIVVVISSWRPRQAQIYTSQPTFPTPTVPALAAAPTLVVAAYQARPGPRPDVYSPVLSLCETPRPNTGVTTYDPTMTVRPNIGTTAYATAVTARPNTGTTERPC